MTSIDGKEDAPVLVSKGGLYVQLGAVATLIVSLGGFAKYADAMKDSIKGDLYAAREELVNTKAVLTTQIRDLREELRVNQVQTNLRLAELPTKEVVWKVERHEEHILDIQKRLTALENKE